MEAPQDRGAQGLDAGRQVDAAWTGRFVAGGEQHAASLDALIDAAVRSCIGKFKAQFGI